MPEQLYENLLLHVQKTDSVIVKYNYCFCLHSKVVLMIIYIKYIIPCIIRSDIIMNGM